ncbi:hypothetical protein GGG16DRAFT_99611 [Schizophyllum commune]
MSDTLPPSFSLPSAADDLAIMISALQRAIRGHYRCRGSRRKCRSPLDFASTSERASVARRFASLRDSKGGSAIGLGKQELEASLGRILQASPDLSSLSLTVREVHGLSLYSIIAALSLDPDGDGVIDPWTESNLLPAMLRVSHIVDTYERLLDACVPETGYFNLSVKPRQKREAEEQLYNRKKAKTDDATCLTLPFHAKEDEERTYYTAKSRQSSSSDRPVKARLPLAPKWPRQ